VREGDEGVQIVGEERGEAVREAGGGFRPSALFHPPVFRSVEKGEAQGTNVRESTMQGMGHRP